MFTWYLVGPCSAGLPAGAVIGAPVLAWISPPPVGVAPLLQTTDLYAAAQARALFDYELSMLFNAGA